MTKRKSIRRQLIAYVLTVGTALLLIKFATWQMLKANAKMNADLAAATAKAASEAADRYQKAHTSQNAPSQTAPPAMAKSP